MPAALGAEPGELLILVTLAALPDQLGVRIIGGTRLGALTANNTQTLLRQVRAREVVGEVSGREDQGAVGKRKHVKVVGRAKGI